MVTASKDGPYAWVPANCLELDGEWYFNIEWHDCPGGWSGKAVTGEKMFHSSAANGPCYLLSSRQLEFAI